MFSYKAQHSYGTLPLQYCSDHLCGDFGNDSFPLGVLFRSIPGNTKWDQKLMLIIRVLLLLLFVFLWFIFILFVVLFLLLPSCLPTGGSLLLWQQITSYYIKQLVGIWWAQQVLPGFTLSQNRYMCKHAPKCTKFLMLDIQILVFYCMNTDMSNVEGQLRHEYDLRMRLCTFVSFTLQFSLGVC